MTNEHLKTAGTAGLILGFLTAIWAFIMTATGWYKDPSLYQAIWLVVVAGQILTISIVLYLTQNGNGYGTQVGIGLITSAAASVPAFVGALVVSGILFPDYFVELQDAREQTMIAEGMEPEVIEETLKDLAPSQTPGGHAFATFMGTLAIGLVTSSMLAIFLRKPESPNEGTT